MSLRRLSIGLLLGVLMGVMSSTPSDGSVAKAAGTEDEHFVKQVTPTIKLIEPIGDRGAIPVMFDEPQNTWMEYFKDGAEWLIELAIGIVAIWILICGAAMILVGDPNKAWRTKMFTSIVGLLGLIFSAVILKFLNANFFT